MHVRVIGGAGHVTAASAVHGAPGTDAMFVDLAQQHSNYCSLQPTAVQGHSDSTRLQGACCSAMDKLKYQYQVTGLQRSASLPAMPRDTYEISAALAKRPHGDDQHI